MGMGITFAPSRGGLESPHLNQGASGPMSVMTAPEVQDTRVPSQSGVMFDRGDAWRFKLSAGRSCLLAVLRARLWSATRPLAFARWDAPCPDSP